MRLLIGGAGSKNFHLKEFGEAISKFGVEYMLVNDVSVVDGFPSRKISNWNQSMNQFNKLIEEFKPDAVFADRQRHFGIAAIKSNLPLILHLRGDFWSEIKWAKNTIYKSFPKNIAIKKWEKIGEENFDGSRIIMPICKYLEKIIHEKYPGKPTYVLQSGINSSRWYKEEGIKLKHPCVGLVQGAVIWGKTKEMLILKKVLEELPNIMFYWAGDGPYAQKVLQELNKYPNFEWLGKLEYPDKVRQFLTEIDVYALISGIDMSPLTLQEAQLMEKPIIATNVGGIPELMENNNSGFLVDKGNAQDIIKKITYLLENEKEARQMGKYGKRMIEKKFSWENIAEGFVKNTKSELNLD
jgi:glycosyltransferase involved in cell wall biosynthesis